MIKNIRRLLDRIPPPPASVDGRRTYRVIAALIVAIGLLLACWGLTLAGVGHAGAHRYAQTSGRLIRIFSESDQTAYQALRTGTLLGWWFFGLGILIGAGGCICYLRPGALFVILRKSGIEA
jgi:hypothetical protein